VKQINVTKSEYIQVHEGEPITVTYLPSDPRINCHGSVGRHLNDRIEFTRILVALIRGRYRYRGGMFEGRPTGSPPRHPRRWIRRSDHRPGRRTASKLTYFWSRYEFTSPTTKRATNLALCTPVHLGSDPVRPGRHHPLRSTMPVAPPASLCISSMYASGNRHVKGTHIGA